MTSRIGQRIKELRKSRGLSQMEFARLCGWKKGHSRISHYEKGVRQPSYNAIEKISKIFGLELQWFYIENEVSPTKKIVEIPIFTWNQIINLNSEKEKNIGVVIDSATNLSPNSFGLIVDNPSMLPTFPLGSTIIIDPNKEIKNNDYIIALIEGKHPALKKFWDDSGNKLLLSDNSAFPSIAVNEKTKFIGPVVKMKVYFQALETEGE